MPTTIATCLAARLATLHELDTIYSLADMWWLLEVHAVESHNRAILNAPQE